ncbi:proline racemase family protein [Aquincola sp. S2]|uniref:Proline racemase family protein n=1 Tax=Pseudaquabacterium terrae TaxID=2732868 RepID=A0ABX2EFH1_9BURK|nr:proline racemase family protein [Aquabacterium terrae]NRF67348.1 proline racemase family protein [Aquabacterium terrae]
MHRISFIDSHTGGEPTRVVLDGLPPLDPTTRLAERRDRLVREHDAWRRAVVCEPRGSDVLVGALLAPPVEPGSAASVIFFNNVGVLGMCGHGAIGVITTLQHLGRIQPGLHVLDTPVGSVRCQLHDDGRVTVQNVPSYRWRAKLIVAVPGIGEVTGDVAWGGNWFFLADWRATPIGVPQIELLTDAAWRIRCALAAQRISGRDGAEIDHIELFAPSEQADSRSFVLCPGKAYDRSPCGTGTSAKLACLAADGKLAPGALWRQQSVVGSVFEARYRWADADADPQADRAVLPEITGRAHVNAEGQLLLDDADPFCWGIQ